MDYYMGVDVGTSGCKAVVFDESGRQISSGYREYDVTSPQIGWAELNPTEVMDKCLQVIDQATAQAPDGKVRGLGISSQGEAFAAIDKDGKALCNALVSFDTRAADYAAKFPAQFGPEKLYQITGQTAHPMFSIFKMLWLRDNQPDLWQRAEKFLCMEDLLQYRLGLDPAISWPLAGRTMLFDVRKHAWNDEILDAVGLSPSKLARPLRSGSVAGKVNPDIARKLGFAPDAFVVTGGHDQPCGALGAGVTAPGLAMYATGTVECLCLAFSDPVFTDDLQKSNLCTYDHTVEGMYATIAFNLTGGNILKWFRDNFGQPEVAEAQKLGLDPYELLLNAAGDQPSDLLVLPYFTATGTPYFDPHATGAILGLRLSTQRGHIIRALLEGITLEMRLNLEILQRSGCPVEEIRAIGGGAKSDTWNQLKADVLGKPVTVLNVTEAASMGAAMLARAADAGTSVIDVAAKWVKPVARKLPRPDIADRYTEKFQTYRQLYPKLRNFKT